MYGPFTQLPGVLPCKPCRPGSLIFLILIDSNYLLGKGGYVFGSVGLFVCLSVDNITQKVMNGLG